MHHMEMVREVEEHRRGMKMSRGLASFVEGRAQLAEADTEFGALGEIEGTKTAGHLETESEGRTVKSNRSTRGSVISIGKSVASIDRKEDYSAALSKTEEALFTAASQTDTSAIITRPDLESVSEPNSFGGTSVNLSSPQGPLGSFIFKNSVCPGSQSHPRGF